MLEKNKKNTASKLFREAYIPKIAADVMDEFGRSYARLEDVQDTWRHTYPCSEELSAMLLFKTHMFIRLLNPQCSESTDPCYLKSLTKRIANYLAVYFARTGQFASTKAAAIYLTEKLYTKDTYISALLQKQEDNRALNKAIRRAKHQGFQKAKTKHPVKSPIGQIQKAVDAFNEMTDRKKQLVLPVRIK